MAASGDHRHDGADSPNQLTIEQLAAQSGMSVRNIRSHQARGLLSPPEVRLRVGYYGPEHVAQLRLIRDLQAEGFNLAGIKRLLDDTQGTAERLIRFKESLTEHREPPETLTLSELGRRFRDRLRQLDSEGIHSSSYQFDEIATNVLPQNQGSRARDLLRGMMNGCAHGRRELHQPKKLVDSLANLPPPASPDTEAVANIQV